MAVKVGGVILDIATDVAKVKTDFDKINKNLKNFSRDAKRIIKTVGVSLGAAFGIHAIKSFIVEGVKVIDNLQDMAQSAGMASREFQGLLQAAKYAGVEERGVAAAVKRLNANILDANKGLSESKRYFEDLGVEHSTFQDTMRDTSAVLYDISDKFQQMDDGGRKAALANKLLGRSGAELIPVLNQGSEGLEKVTERLERYGAIVSDETMGLMDKVNQNLIDMGTAIDAINLQILAGMADELKTITDVMTNNADTLGMFKEMGEWFGTLATWIAASTVGFAAFMDLWGSFAGMIAGAGIMGFFEQDLNRMMIDELDATLAKWGTIIKDLRGLSAIPPRAAPPDMGIDTEPEVISKVNKLMEERKQLFSSLVKTSKSKIELLQEEYKTLLSIQEVLREEKDLTSEQLEIYNAVGDRIIKIVQELKRINTEDIWGNMKYGFLDYHDTIKDRSKQIQEATVNGFRTMEDALVGFVARGKLEWASLRDAILSDIARIIIRQQIIMPLIGGIAGSMEGGTITSSEVEGMRARRSRRGRRATSYTGASADLSVDLQNIVAENTYLMNRDVEDFVKNSTRQFEELGRTLRKNLTADVHVGTGGVGGGAGTGGTIGGGAVPGGTIGGTVPSGGGIFDVGDISIDSALIWVIATEWALDIAEAIVDKIFGKGSSDALIDDLADINIDDINIITAATDWSLRIAEAAIDSIFGKGTADDIIDRVTDTIKGLSFDNISIKNFAKDWAVSIGTASALAVFHDSTAHGIKSRVINMIKDIEFDRASILTASASWAKGIGKAAADAIFGDNAQEMIGKVRSHVGNLDIPVENLALAVPIWGTAIIDSLVSAVGNAIANIDFSNIISIPGVGNIGWEDLIFPFVDPGGIIRDIFGGLFHGGGTVGGGPRMGTIPRFHNGLRNDERLGILQVGEEVIPKDEVGKGGITINVPVTMPERNPRMAGELREEIEKTVLNVMRKYI